MKPLEILQAIRALLALYELETAEEIDATLLAAGYDSVEVAAKLVVIAERILAQHPIRWE